MSKVKYSSGVTRLEPASASHLIAEPSMQSEFEVQAWLFCALKQAGFNVRGEVKQKFTLAGKRAVCRFDLVIFKNGVATIILEVKSSPTRHSKGIEGTRQGIRYGHYGVPVLFVYGMEGAELALSQITSL